jgi:3',5'-cyclic AMP phosphodiesterase CpdA
MTGDIKLTVPYDPADPDTLFPFVRQRRNIALIGLSSAVPQSLFRAGGPLGSGQLDRLGPVLQDLRQRGFYRVVLIHHPPVPGLTPRRRALDDARKLKQILEEHGADLVLYGHNHRHGRSALQTQFGTAHIIGAPSATSPGHGAYDAASWYLYKIRRQDSAWVTTVTVRRWDKGKAAFVADDAFTL